MLTGYAHPDYVASLAEFGTPRQLPRSGGWLLERAIPGTNHRDAMGAYPLFACSDWAALPADLDDLQGDLVSVAFVTDPFGDFDLEQMKGHLDLLSEYKTHYVIDLALPRDDVVSKSHRKHARRALRNVSVEVCDRPNAHLDEWVGLYDNLIRRHNLSGLHAFSREAFSRQLSVPGCVLFIARHAGEAVGALCFYLSGAVAYAHLSAHSQLGYTLGSAYALRWCAIEYFADKVRWLDNGGAAGVYDSDSGLALFKTKWSTGARVAYFCGRVLRPDVYSELSQGIATTYFPAYRVGEFG